MSTEFCTKFQSKDGIDYIFTNSKSQIINDQIQYKIDNSSEFISDLINTWSINNEVIKNTIENKLVPYSEKKDLLKLLSKIKEKFEYKIKQRSQIGEIKGRSLLTSLVQADIKRKIEMSKAQALDQIADLNENLGSKVESAKSLEKKFKEYEKYIQKSSRNNPNPRFEYFKTFSMKNFVDANLQYYDDIEEAKKLIVSHNDYITKLVKEIKELKNLKTSININNKDNLSKHANESSCGNYFNTMAKNNTGNLTFNVNNNTNLSCNTKINQNNSNINSTVNTNTSNNKNKGGSFKETYLSLFKNSKNKTSKKDIKGNITVVPTIGNNAKLLLDATKQNKSRQNTRMQSVDYNSNYNQSPNIDKETKEIIGTQKNLISEEQLKKSRKIMVFYLNQIKELEHRIKILKAHRAKLSVGLTVQTTDKVLVKNKYSNHRKDVSMLNISVIDKRLDESHFNDFNAGATFLDGNLTRMQGPNENWDITYIEKKN